MPNINANPFLRRPDRPAIGANVRFRADLNEWEAVFADPPVFKEFVKTAPTGKRGEELFQLILSGIREIYDVEAVIAGGAVRDLAAGVIDHKDVDVFIPMDPDAFAKHADELGWSGGFSKVKPYDPTDACIIQSIGRGAGRVQGCAVDLVFLDKPLDKDTVAKFPVHAQRCVWTLEGGQSLAPEAIKDLDNKTFTIDPTITDKERIAKIVEKINGWKKRADYKDWKIVEPTIKEWWEQ